MDKKKKTIVFTAIFALTMVAIILFSLTRPASPLDKSIVKQFVYDIEATGYPPVAGLSVDLYNNDLTPVATETTDVDGYVTFVNLVDGTYTLEWMWGGVEDRQQQQIDCAQLVWDFGTSYLQSKSGGGI